MSCKWVKEEDGYQFFLPDCIGGAVYGPHGCTCKYGAMHLDELKENAEYYYRQNIGLRCRISELENEIKQLKRKGPN